MRIIHSLEGKAWSGGQQQALLLALGQRDAGHHIRLLCQKGSELEARSRAAGLEVVPVDYRSEANPLAIAHLNRVFRDFQPEVVNVHRAWAHTQWFLVALHQRFRGLIVTRRVLFRPDRNPLSLVKYRSPVIRGFIAVSRAVGDLLEAQGVPGSRIRVVHSATDCERFSPGVPQSLSGPWPLPEQAEVILLIGNFSPNKGHLLLVDAFERIAGAWPEAHLVMAGHGMEQGRLVDRVASSAARSRIRLLGFRTDAPALFARSRLSVNASFEEGFSGTVRESLVMGVPVVASDIPANREISALVPLRLFTSGSAESLATALLAERRAGTNEASRWNLREKAVARFSVPRMIRATIEAYQSLGIGA